MIARHPHAIAAERGAVVGAINAICVAVMYAIAWHVEAVPRTYSFGPARKLYCGVLNCPDFVSRESTLAMWIAVVMHVLPISILFGALFGSMVKDLEVGWFVQTFSCVALAITVSGAVMIVWPALLPFAWISGAAHAVALVLWLRWAR